MGRGGRGIGEGKRLKKRQNKTKRENRKLQHIQLGVSTGAGKAQRKSPWPSLGVSGKASRAEEAEWGFVGQAGASQPGGECLSQPGGEGPESATGRGFRVS